MIHLMGDEIMDIYINPPREVITTHEEFDKFTYWDVASFFINHKACIYIKDNSIRIWTNSWSLAITSLHNYRFKGEEWYEREDTELYYCDVKNEKLKDFILKKFKHLTLK
jgi:predicted methyltransferase